MTLILPMGISYLFSPYSFSFSSCSIIYYSVLFEVGWIGMKNNQPAASTPTKDGSQRKLKVRKQGSIRLNIAKIIPSFTLSKPKKSVKELSKEMKNQKEDKSKRAVKAKKTTDKKKKKKKKNKKDSDSEEESGSDEAAPSSDPITLRSPFAPKEILRGALSKPPPNPDGYFLRLMQEERPDLFGPNCTVDAVDAEQLDGYLREKNELAPMDLIYVEDNFDKEDRNYVRYQILAKFNEGRYSAIYVVTKQLCKENEKIQDKSALFMLKMPLRKHSATAVTKMKREIRVLQDMSQQKLSICPTVFNFGKVCDSPFFVMSLLDMNLEKMREMQKGPINGPTAIHIGMETLNCLTELHLRNYVHFDVKPSNFCIGFGSQDKRIYIIDLADTIKKKGKTLRIPPPNGLTLPYMSMDQHLKYAARERSDIESWYYMLVDFLQPELINWKGKTSEAEVESLKKQFWKGMLESSSGLTDVRVQSIGEMINPKATFDKEDYVKMKQMLATAMEAQLAGAKFVPQWAATPAK